MVMNSFGKRNFMQPMGRRPKHAFKVPCSIFLLSLGRGRDYFSFSPSSQCVPTMFQVQVPNGFSIHSPSSQHVLHSTSLLSHMLWQMLSSFQLGQIGWTQNKTFYFGETPEFLLFIYWWANQIDSLQTKIELGRHFAKNHEIIMCVILYHIVIRTISWMYF